MEEVTERGRVDGSGREAQGGGKAGERACSVGCISVPVGVGADGVTGAETTEVGIQWVFMELWAVWLEQKGVLGEENIPLFISLSPKLYFTCLEGQTKPHSSLFS